MQKRLEGELRFLIGNDFGKRRDNAGEEMMLVGKTAYAQTIFFRRFSDVGPVDVRADVGLANFFEGRIKTQMARSRLDDFASPERSHAGVLLRSSRSSQVATGYSSVRQAN